MAKKQYRPKVKYIDKVEYFKFKDVHSMIQIPQKVNPDTGFGEAFTFGVPKAKAILKNMIAIRKFVQEHEDELRTIKDDAHLKQEEASE